MGVASFSFSQINISFDDNCLNYNASIVSRAIIKTFGSDTVKKLLENNTNITFVCDVDSLGHLLEIDKIYSKQKLPKDFIARLKNYLITNKIRFFICYQLDPLDIDKYQIVNLERNQFKNNNSRTIGSIAFPGVLMGLYEYEKEKKKSRNICLSKYNYLLKQIDKYLPRPIGYAR